MISDFISPGLIPSPSLAATAESSCHVQAINASLRAWIEATPAAPGLALPPGSVQPGKTVSPSTSHVLNVELKVHSSSDKPQDVRVSQALWSHGSQQSPFEWKRQPVMSSFNRFSTIQRLPMDLVDEKTVQVETQLMINSNPCVLVTSAEVVQR